MIELMLKLLTYEPYEVVSGNEKDYIDKVLSENITSKPNKYKIKKYNKEYSDSLQDDSNFNIIKTFVISLDECRKFCENLAHRQFKGAYWNQITVKIAVK